MPDTRPVLVCVGTSADVARALAAQAVPLLRGRRAVVLSAWRPAEATRNPVTSVLDALFEESAEIAAELERVAAGAVAAAAEELESAGWEVERRPLRSGAPVWSVALEMAEELDATVIVAGANDRSELPPGALGSEVRALAHRTHRPLLVLPRESVPADAAAPALIAYDGSPSARAALAATIELVAPRRMLVATAWNSVRALVPMALAGTPALLAQEGSQVLDDAARDHAADVAAEGAGRIAGSGAPVGSVAIDSPGSAWIGLIERAAADDAALVVCGTRGHSRVATLILGSVAEGLLRHAQRPVLLVPAPEVDS